MIPNTFPLKKAREKLQLQKKRQERSVAIDYKSRKESQENVQDFGSMKIITVAKERTSSMLDCKHNVLQKPILLKMEKEIINL